MQDFWPASATSTTTLSSTPAIDFYQRALKVEPANAGVRTDMATGTVYRGRPIPPSRNSRNRFPMNRISPTRWFNLGIVEWQGKMDIGKATAAWQSCHTNPNYEAKTRFCELMAQAKKH